MTSSAVPPAPDLRTTSLAAPTDPGAATQVGYWRGRLGRMMGGPGRVVGLDVARGLAILGMFVAHLDNPSPDGSTGVGWWSWMLDGRSSILFATLAGISIAIMSGRTRPLEAVPALQVRMRILVRAVCLFAIGDLLTMLGTPVAVILQSYAVLFVLSLPFLRWSARRLGVLTAVCALVLPLLRPVLDALHTWGEMGDVPLVDLLVTGTYPGVVWFTFVLLGMTIGRCDLGRRDVQLWLLGAGTAVAAGAYALALAVGTGVAAIDLGSQPWGGEPEPAPG